MTADIKYISDREQALERENATLLATVRAQAERLEALTAPVDPGLFEKLIANHPGLAEELAAIDLSPKHNSSNL